MTTQKFDFRRQLKGKSLEWLQSLKDYHLDLMIAFIGFDDKEAAKHSRYVSYINNEISKLTTKTTTI